MFPNHVIAPVVPLGAARMCCPLRGVYRFAASNLDVFCSTQRFSQVPCGFAKCDMGLCAHFLKHARASCDIRELFVYLSHLCMFLLAPLELSLGCARIRIGGPSQICEPTFGEATTRYL